jgi:hypothetical protein
MGPDAADCASDQRRDLGHALDARAPQGQVGALALAWEVDPRSGLRHDLPDRRPPHEGHAHQQGQAGQGSGGTGVAPPSGMVGKSPKRTQPMRPLSMPPKVISGQQCRCIYMWQGSHQQPWSFRPRLRQVYLDNSRVRQ